MSCIKDLYFIDNPGYQINYTTFNLIKYISIFQYNKKKMRLIRNYIILITIFNGSLKVNEPKLDL
jgi:hypothetical protein